MARPRPKAPTDKDRHTAKIAVARRFEAQPSGKLRVPLVLYLPRDLVEELSAQAITEGKKLELVVEEILAGARNARG